MGARTAQRFAIADGQPGIGNRVAGIVDDASGKARRGRKTEIQLDLILRSETIGRIGGKARGIRQGKLLLRIEPFSRSPGKTTARRLPK